jgi:hypothetical protein
MDFGPAIVRVDHVSTNCLDVRADLWLGDPIGVAGAGGLRFLWVTGFAQTISRTSAPVLRF